jgi:hypothetical protein
LTAAELQSSDIIAGRSSVLSIEQQAKFLGDAWERLSSRPQERIRFRVIGSDDEIRDFYLGAHAPDLTDEEINFIHKLWLNVREERGLENIRHKHIVVAALVRLADELHADRRQNVLDFVRALTNGEAIQGRRKRTTIRRRFRRR